MKERCALSTIQRIIIKPSTVALIHSLAFSLLINLYNLQ
jgi:hypothetical protein